MSAAAFFREYLKNWKTVGAVAPSSPALAKMMVEMTEVRRARSVLEIGPGTGAFTKAIAAEKPSSADYLGIEVNADFTRRLMAAFPGLRFANAPAQEFDFASEAGHSEGRYDVIISGLPWAAFPPSLQTAILDHVLPHLAEGGRFATFAYWGFHLLPAGRRFRALLHERLPGVEITRVVWRNLPPAMVYVARR